MPSKSMRGRRAGGLTCSGRGWQVFATSRCNGGFIVTARSEDGRSSRTLIWGIQQHAVRPLILRYDRTGIGCCWPPVPRVQPKPLHILAPRCSCKTLAFQACINVAPGE